MGAREKKAAKKCKCKSACFAPHTQTLHINSHLQVPFQVRDKQILSFSVLEPHKTSSLQNTFTLLLPEAKISTYLGKRRRNKNISEKHTYCKCVYCKRFAFYTETKGSKICSATPIYTWCLGHDTVKFLHPELIEKTWMFCPILLRKKVEF